jgi:formylglycine-generating enzyme required for sulfatase activity
VADADNNPSNFSACAQCPVERVNWWEALAYANALSQLEMLAECYTLSGCTGMPGNDMTCSGVTVNAPGNAPYACAGYRLPTEAEWEYAYRAGTTTAFYNGAITDETCNEPNLDSIGWYCGNANDKTHDVGTVKQPNAWGLSDMAVNVWEWCWDWYGSYARNETDPLGPVMGSLRVGRGGAWNYYAKRARAANRNYGNPDDRYDYLGFRLSRSAP